ncbi:zinc ribbon domain-containing protein [Streptomyces sp. NPDC006514]|uniref:zinc ribbon domain-containing protein n=1 Tax=Streptomyces sp. NPDC006514 TaxID=3154308 RepID=UPI0033A59691
MVAKLLDGQSLRSVAKWMNDQGYDSPRWASRKQRIAQLEAKGEPLKAQKLREKPIKTPNSWSWPVVRQLVISPTLAGYLPHKGEVHRHTVTGEMVRISEEIISFADHTRLRSMFGSRIPVHWTRDATPGSKSKETGRAVTGLMSDYLDCGECGSRMSYDTAFVRKGEVWPRYRCIRRHFSGRCPGVLIILAIAQRWADMKHPDRKARRSQLEALIREEEQFLDRLEDEKLNGLFQGTRGEARFKRRYDVSNGRLDGYEKELRELPEGQALDITFLRDTELFKEAWANWPLAERREIVGLVLERAWVVKARKTGVRPSFDRFRFWWVGEERPEGLTFPTTLTEADARPTPA